MGEVVITERSYGSVFQNCEDTDRQVPQRQELGRVFSLEEKAVRRDLQVKPVSREDRDFRMDDGCLSGIGLRFENQIVTREPQRLKDAGIECPPRNDVESLHLRLGHE